MIKNNIFLRDFVTFKKIKNYVIYIFLFAIFTNIFFEDKHVFQISSLACSTIGIGIAFTSTAYVIYTYSTFENMKLYLTLPIGKWKLFFSYFFALWTCTVIQRISFVIVIIINFGSNVLLNSILLLLNSGAAILINIGILLSKNGKRKAMLFVNIFLLILLVLLGGLDLHFAYKYLFTVLIGICAVMTFFKSAITDLVITHKLQNKFLTKGITNYFLKVVLAEKIYLVNTACIVAFLFIFCLISKDNPLLFHLVWCIGAINTPFVTMISGDVWIARHIDMLPIKQNNIYRQYAYFLSIYFAAVNLIILLIKSVITKVSATDIFLSLLLAVLETITAVILEKRYRITKWQTKQELWKNPRKYILPLMIFAVVSIYNYLTGYL